MKSQYVVGARKLCPNHPAMQQPVRAPLPPLTPGILSRFKDIKPYLPVGRETWRQLVLAGRAPQPIHLSARCTLWHNDEVIVWLADPVAFKVEG